MSNTRIVLGLAAAFGITICAADDKTAKGPPKASLKASLSGDARNPVLNIRLRNIGDDSIVVDKELVFLADIALLDKERLPIRFKETREVIERPPNSDLKNRFGTLNPGEEITRRIELRKDIKRFVTGSSIPVEGSGEAPRIVAYESLCRMPADAQPFEIDVSYEPPNFYFEDAFAQYTKGIDAAVKLYRGPLQVRIPYKFENPAKKTQSDCPATKKESH